MNRWAIFKSPLTRTQLHYTTFCAKPSRPFGPVGPYHLVLKFHELKADGCTANVLGPVRYGITIYNVAGSEVCFSDRTVSTVVADLSASDDIDDIGGMRVHLFLNA